MDIIEKMREEYALRAADGRGSRKGIGFYEKRGFFQQASEVFSGGAKVRSTGI
jgi:hypothetical protein